MGAFLNKHTDCKIKGQWDAVTLPVYVCCASSATNQTGLLNLFDQRMPQNWEDVVISQHDLSSVRQLQQPIFSSKVLLLNIFFSTSLNSQTRHTSPAPSEATLQMGAAPTLSSAPLTSPQSLLQFYFGRWGLFHTHSDYQLNPGGREK